MKNIVACIFLFILGVALYAATVRGVMGEIDMAKARGNYDRQSEPLELSPERGRYVLTYSLAERKTFALDEKLAAVADPDVGFYKDKFYIYFAPGISVLALPFYIVGKAYGIPQVASFFTISIFATFNLILVYLLSKKVFKISTALSLFSALIFGFGSTSWSYAITMYQHHVTTFFILSTFLATFYFTTANKMKWIYAAYVWFAYGLAIFIDYPNIMLMAPVVAYLTYASFSTTEKKGKTLLSFNMTTVVTSIVFIGLVALHGYYNYIHFDSWTRLSGSLIGYDKVREEKTKEKGKTAVKKIEDLANKKGDSVFFEEENLPNGFFTLTTSPDRGIFIFSPIFYLMLLGIYKKVKEKFTAETFFLLSIVFTNVFLYSSWGDPAGGWAFGPRYLIPTMAIGSSFIGFWLYKNTRPVISRLLTYTLFLISSGISLLGALTTNQVPPKVEADFFGANYNFFLNFYQMLEGKSSSFMYNNFFANNVSLMNYYMIIFLSLAIIVAIIVFLMPFESHEH